MWLHHDFGISGRAFYPRAMEWQLEMLREMGCNAIRTSTFPWDPEFHAICDRMGFLVMNDAFDEWQIKRRDNTYHRFFDEWSERDSTSMVKRGRNHPSVILWSIGNDVRDQYSANAYDISERLVDIVRKHDPTRPVMASLNSPVNTLGMWVTMIETMLRTQNASRFAEASGRWQGRVRRRSGLGHRRRLRAAAFATPLIVRPFQDGQVCITLERKMVEQELTDQTPGEAIAGFA